MHQPDYYSFLGIRSNATNTEIRKAFRKLALIHHPDKDLFSATSNEKFRQIHEAYLVLSDSRKRAAYDFERKLLFQNKIKPNKPETEAELFQILRKLNTQITLQDPYRMDRDILSYQLKEILAEHNLQLLEPNSSKAFVKEVIKLIQICSQHFTKDQIKQAVNLLKPFMQKSSTNPLELTELHHSLLQVYYWKRYKVLFAFIVTLLLCLMMFTLTQKK